MLKFKNKEPTRQRRTPQLRRQDTPVFSYYSNRTPRPEAPVRGRNVLSGKKLPVGISRIREIPTLISVLVIGFAVLYALTLSADPKIVLNDRSGQFGQPLSVYHDAARDIIASSLLNYTKLTINSDAVAESFELKYPEVTSATLQIPLLGRRPVLDVEVEEPVMLLRTQSGDYYVRSDGVAIISSDKVTQPSGTIPVVGDESGLAIQTGKVILTRQTTAFIRDALNQLKAGNIEVQSVTLPKIPNELRVKVTGQAYYLRLNLAGDARLQIGTYRALLGQFDKDNTRPKEYIDLRVEERVFYK